MEKTQETPNPPRVILYLRVSTGKQAASGLGLTDQLATMTEHAKLKGWEVVDTAQDAGKSGKEGSKRPGLDAAMTKLDAGEADILLAAKMDRVARSTVDFGSMVTRSEKRGWSLAVLDIDLDTTSAAGKLMATVLMAMAQFESERIAERVKAAHGVRKAQGQRYGRLPELADVLRHRIADERAAGRNLQDIADDLNRDGVPTARGGRWHASTIAHVVRSVQLDREAHTGRKPARQLVAV